MHGTAGHYDRTGSYGQSAAINRPCRNSDSLTVPSEDLVDLDTHHDPGAMRGCFMQPRVGRLPGTKWTARGAVSAYASDFAASEVARNGRDMPAELTKALGHDIALCRSRCRLGCRAKLLADGVQCSAVFVARELVRTEFGPLGPDGIRCAERRGVIDGLSSAPA